MPSIQELRNNYSVLDENNLSDEDVIQWVADQTGETTQEVAAYLAPAEEAYEYDPYAALDSSSGLGDNSQYESEDTTGWRDVGDVGTGLLSGTAKAAGAIVGLGSLVPGLHYIADPLSAWLQKGGEAIDEALLSDRQQEINQELSTRLQAAAGELGPDASYSDYFDAIVSQGGEAGSFVADHPGQVANLIATSIPYIFGGGAITKGVKGAAELAGLKKVSEMGGITGAAVGEGAITSGEVTKNIIEKTGTSGDYTAGRLAAVPAGLGTAGISLISGRVASKAGVADIDVAVTNKIAGTSTDLVAQASKKGLVRSTLTGSATEATEELFQGGQEKIFENIGTGEHPLTDVGGDAVMGAFAGAGQGAGINVIKSMSGSDVQLTQAQKEEESKIAAEQAQEMEDEEFIADAGAIASTQDSRAFAVKWSKILGVSTDEVFQDPRFGVVQEERELQAQEDATKEKRRIHAPTFPDEKVWYKENDAEKIERQRMDIANEQTELGSAFATWQKDNDVYDSNDEVIEDFLSDPAIQDLLPELDDSREPYFAALDAHANFKEQEATRTEEEQQQAEAVVAELLTVRNEAVSNKDLGGIAAVEQRAAEVLDPAEWAIAKRSKSVAKGKSNASAKEGDTPPGGVPPITQMGQSAAVGPYAPTNPFTRKERKAAWDKAASIYGPNFEAEHPDVKELLHATPESKKFSAAAVDKLLDKKQNADKAQSVGTAAELFQYIAEDTSGNYTENQKKVASVLFNAATSNTLDEYYDLEVKTKNENKGEGKNKDKTKVLVETNEKNKYRVEYIDKDEGEGNGEPKSKPKKASWSPSRIYKEAGLKSRQNAEQVIEQLETNIAKFHGEDALANIRRQTQASVNAKNLINEASTGETYEGGSQEYGGGASALEISEMGIVKRASDTTSNTDALSTGEKKLVDANAETKGKEETKETLHATRKEQEKVVAKAMSSNMDAHRFRKEWERNKPEGAGSFDSLPTPAKHSWIYAVDVATQSGNYVLLKEDAAEIDKKFKDNKDGDADVKTNKRAKEKSGGQSKGRNENPRKPSKPRADPDKSRTKVPKNARKPEVVQNLEAAAQESLGALWASEHPHIAKLLTQKKYKKFESEVTAIAEAKEGGRVHKSVKQVVRKEESVASARAEAITYANTALKSSDWFLDHPKLAELLQARDITGFRAEVSRIAKGEPSADATKESLGSRSKRDVGAESKTERKESFASKHPGLLAMLNKNKEPNKKSTAENSKKGKKFDSILGMLFKGAVPKHIRDHFHFVNNADELNALFPEDKDKASADTGGLYRRNVSIDGTAEDVVFVMDNIKEGTEMALFLHEVGSHLGLDSLFSNLDTRYVVDKIEDWFRSEPTMPLMKGGRLNPKDPVAIARRAMDRVGVAVSRGSLKTNRDVDSEIIAYS